MHVLSNDSPRELLMVREPRVWIKMQLVIVGSTLFYAILP